MLLLRIDPKSSHSRQSIQPLYFPSRPIVTVVIVIIIIIVVVVVAILFTLREDLSGRP